MPDQNRGKWIIEHKLQGQPDQIDESIVFTRDKVDDERYPSAPIYRVMFDESVAPNGVALRGTVHLVAKYRMLPGQDPVTHHYQHNESPLSVGQSMDVAVSKHELRIVIAGGTPASHFRWSGSYERIA
jgi:hypothetical protein